MLKFHEVSGEDIVGKIEEKRKRVRKHIINTHFPEHREHTQIAVDAETMYGLLIVEYNKCSCGETLEFDRDMFVDPGEKVEENK